MKRTTKRIISVPISILLVVAILGTAALASWVVGWHFELPLLSAFVTPVPAELTPTAEEVLSIRDLTERTDDDWQIPFFVTECAPNTAGFIQALCQTGLTVGEFEIIPEREDIDYIDITIDGLPEGVYAYATLSYYSDSATKSPLHETRLPIDNDATRFGITWRSNDDGYYLLTVNLAHCVRVTGDNTAPIAVYPHMTVDAGTHN